MWLILPILFLVWVFITSHLIGRYLAGKEIVIYRLSDKPFILGFFIYWFINILICWICGIIFNNPNAFYKILLIVNIVIIIYFTFRAFISNNWKVKWEKEKFKKIFNFKWDTFLYIFFILVLYVINIFLIKYSHHNNIFWFLHNKVALKNNAFYNYLNSIKSILKIKSHYIFFETYFLNLFIVVAVFLLVLINIKLVNKKTYEWMVFFIVFIFLILTSFISSKYAFIALISITIINTSFSRISRFDDLLKRNIFVSALFIFLYFISSNFLFLWLIWVFLIFIMNTLIVKKIFLNDIFILLLFSLIPLICTFFQSVSYMNERYIIFWIVIIAIIFLFLYFILYHNKICKYINNIFDTYTLFKIILLCIFIFFINIELQYNSKIQLFITDIRKVYTTWCLFPSYGNNHFEVINYVSIISFFIGALLMLFINLVYKNKRIIFILWFNFIVIFFVFNPISMVIWQNFFDNISKNQIQINFKVLFYALIINNFFIFISLILPGFFNRNKIFKKKSLLSLN